jgi:hypothetical protein
LTTSEDASDSTADAYAQRVFPSPSEKLLTEIYRLTRQIRGHRWRDAQDEKRAESALRLMVNELTHVNFNEMTLPATTAQANALIASADEWLSLASSICCRVYAPASPMPRRLLKWSRNVADLLRMICSIIERPISSAARLLVASSWTVAASFPWGVSLGLDFDTSIGSSARQTSTDDTTVQDLQQQLTDTQEALSEARTEIDHLRGELPLELSQEVREAIQIINRSTSRPEPDG